MGQDLRRRVPRLGTIIEVPTADDGREAEGIWIGCRQGHRTNGPVISDFRRRDLVLPIARYSRPTWASPFGTASQSANDAYLNEITAFWFAYIVTRPLGSAPLSESQFGSGAK